MIPISGMVKDIELVCSIIRPAPSHFTTNPVMDGFRTETWKCRYSQSKMCADFYLKPLIAMVFIA